nr:uncharacterized protein LOC104084442 [Nicotiana tomentosiformis]XP_033508859.1 uncharacterized protein LOC104084442 [Nicotiana tomentosiformis]
MDEGESEDVSKKDPAWKYTISNQEKIFFRCRFCTQKCSTINRLKYHLAGTRKGMKPCPKVPADVGEECKKALLELKNSKARRNTTIEEIRIAATGGSNIGGVANFGPGFQPPTMHELRTWILKEEVANFNRMLEEHKNSWKQYGCSIMSDSWSDGKSRCFINFLVNSPTCTFFLRSIDASDSIKSGEMLASHLNKLVDDVGEGNVVQMIYDNDSNFVNAGKRIMETRPHIYWTPCAAHCIDLMLEDIGKLKIHQETLKRTKDVVKLIYGHTWVLDLMRSFMKNHELLRPAVTRFATAYLILQSIQKQKQALRSMFSSEAWNTFTWAKKHEGVKTRATVLFDQTFWPHIAYCVRSVTPLVSVLREVDSEEQPCMGYMYHLMTKAKENIALNCGNYERKYGPIWKRIDERWSSQLYRPLHAAGYYLNPQL